jgi:hypothetical protein
MNFIPFMTSFVNVNLHYKFKDLFDSLSYQRTIRSETLRNLLQFLKNFTSAIQFNKKGKLRLDLPFKAIPAAIILYSNTIPLTQSSLFIKVFIQDAPMDIINLFERLHVTINFAEKKIRVTFAEFDNLIHLLHIKCSTLIFETRNHILFYNTMLKNSSILELIYNGIDQSLRNFLITREPIANLLPLVTCQVRFRRGDAWKSENLFDGGGIHHNTFKRPYPRLQEHYHTGSHLV